MSLVVLAVTTVDAGSVWDIAFFDPKEVYLGVFLLFGTSPTRMLVISTDNNCNVEIAWAKASLSVCVHVLHWDDERRLPAVRLKTSSTRTRSYVTMARKGKKKSDKKLGQAAVLSGKMWAQGRNQILETPATWLYVVITLTHACVPVSAKC